MASEEDWKRLASRVRTSRIALGIETLEQWAQETGLSLRTVSSLERGRPARAKTLAVIERALGWSAGKAEEILIGPPPDITRGLGALIPTAAIEFDEEPVSRFARQIPKLVDEVPEQIQANLLNMIEIAIATYAHEKSDDEPDAGIEIYEDDEKTIARYAQSEEDAVAMKAAFDALNSVEGISKRDRDGYKALYIEQRGQ